LQAVHRVAGVDGTLNRQLHSIADKIDDFTAEFRDEATKGTGIDELVKQAKALLEDAAARTPLMGLTAAEQAKLAKVLKRKR
jgi:hypothetical protein